MYINLQICLLLQGVKKKRLHISKILAALMLLVFAIALTPWSMLHHHPQAEVVHVEKEEHCTHKLHLSKHVDNCLVCAAHFIKDFVNVTATFQIFLQLRATVKEIPTLSSSYAALRSTSLRGPPFV
mgnify:CR=1 FL=1